MESAGGDEILKGALPQQGAPPVKIQIGRNDEEKVVVMAFSRPVRFLTLPRNQAIDVGNAILKNARKLR